MKLCLYHRSDLDGRCSGAIYHRAHPGGELFGIDYGDDVPWDKIKGADLTVIDWSFQPWSEFVKAMQLAEHITWIDHHKSAIDEWEANEIPPLCCEVDTSLTLQRMDFAGCELAWMHFFPDETKPLGVTLLGRYDVWNHRDPRVLPYQYGMRILDTDPCSPAWIPVLTTGSSDPWHGERIKIGESLLLYQKQQDAAAVEKAWFAVEMNGLRWQACNRLGKGSQFFDSVWDRDAFHGMLSFGWDGKQWVVGLYSDRDGVDCSAIAKAHGGGGHKGAAGFRCDELPFTFTGR